MRSRVANLFCKPFTTLRRMGGPRSQRTAAFTLAEFLVMLALLGALLAIFAPAPQVHGFLVRRYQDPSGEESPYVLFVPHEYQGDRPYPLLVFLHGHNDLYRLTGVGLGKAIARREKSFPLFVLFPGITRVWTEDSAEVRRAMRVLDKVVRDYNIDERRISLTGLSDGGTGTWHVAARYPERWAAIVPVAAAGVPDLAPRIKHVPCWCFHGGADKGNNHVEGARQMMAALRAAGGEPRYTEVPGFDHNVWDIAYGKPELYEWLLAQARP